jgi:cell wall-associated NlpC family hydrolase
MKTIAYLCILLALLIIRGVTKGRGITELPGDLASMFTALVTSDQKGLAAVLARTGDANTPTVAAGSSAAPGTATGTGGTGLLANAQRLAAAAGNKYRWGATGPDAYDCSGLVWAALGKPGLRFTTYTFTTATHPTRTTTPAPGDVVLWTSHMGIVDGPGTMFSALNTKYGIIHSPISWGGSGQTPSYWKLAAPAATKAASTGARYPLVGDTP